MLRRVQDRSRAAPAMVVCRGCGYELSRSSFSSNQLRSWGNQTCKECNAAPAHGSSAHYDSDSSDDSSDDDMDDSDDPYYDSDADYDTDEEDLDDAMYRENSDISDVRYAGPNLEGFLSNLGWEMDEDREEQGVYYRNHEQEATLTIWYQTGKYRTKLDRDTHPTGNRQMFGPIDGAGRRVIQDIMEVARHVRVHTNNRYSDSWHYS